MAPKEGPFAFRRDKRRTRAPYSDDLLLSLRRLREIWHGAP